MYAETNYDAASLFDTPPHSPSQETVEEYLCGLEGPGGNKQRCGMLCDAVADKLESVLSGKWEGGEKWEAWVGMVIKGKAKGTKRRREEDAQQPQPSQPTPSPEKEGAGDFK